MKFAAKGLKAGSKGGGGRAEKSDEEKDEIESYNRNKGDTAAKKALPKLRKEKKELETILKTKSGRAAEVGQDRLDKVNKDIKKYMSMLESQS